MYKLAFFVPADAAESVKDAIFETDAGRLGHYEACCFQTRGTGQFRPLAGAEPHIGNIDALTQVDEFKVELVCHDEQIHAAVAALRLAHPYEEPAYDVWQLAEI